MLVIKTKYLVSVYLAAVVLSNLLVTHFGQKALILTGFVFIPFDFVVRDILHDRWSEGLWKKMFALILAGALISVCFNLNATNVAIASVIAFSVGTALNTFLYGMLKQLPRVKRMTISNTFVSFIDSTLFPLLAFGVIDWRLSCIQILLKSSGGFVWAKTVTQIKIK